MKIEPLDKSQIQVWNEQQNHVGNIVNALKLSIKLEWHQLMLHWCHYCQFWKQAWSRWCFYLTINLSILFLCFFVLFCCFFLIFSRYCNSELNSRVCASVFYLFGRIQKKCSLFCKSVTLVSSLTFGPLKVWLK